MRLLILCLCSALLLFSNAGFASEGSTTIVRTGAVDGDTYLAGERIKIDAIVDGDLILAAGDINVGGRVSGDLMAAGSQVSITAELADDVRAVGGDLSLCSIVTGDALLAGAKVDICSKAIIQNNAWVAGADVTIDGRIEGDLTIRAGNVRLSGIFLNDVNIEATSIEVLENTEIMGYLVYKSPNPANIHDSATILGEEDYTIADTWWGNQSGFLSSSDMFKIGLGLFLFVVLSNLLTGFSLSCLLPETYINTDQIIRTQFLPSIAAGLLVALITPIVLILLTITIVAIPLAWIGLLVYLLILATGGYAGLLFIADTIFQSFKRDFTHSKTSKLLSILVAVLVLLLVGFIPLIGSVVLLLVYLGGIGALCLHLINQRTQLKRSRTQLEEKNS